MVRVLDLRAVHSGFESHPVLKFFYFKLDFVFQDKFYFEHDLDPEIVKVNLTTSRSMCIVQKVNCFLFYQLWYGP